MERCPNCGQFGRMGAKFCTICGHRIAADAASEPTPTNHTDADAEPSLESLTASEDVAERQDHGDDASWPSPPPEERSNEASWPIYPGSLATTSPVSEESGANEADEELPSIWAASPTAIWPTPAAHDTGEPVVNGEDRATSEPASLDADLGPEAPEAADASVEGAREQAFNLLDDLRQAIAAISGDEPSDLSGIIEELDVAVTPPGAIGTEELASLREALLAARERPRDIDTMVALTGRLDEMVALVFAYERAIAAIERSLEALRRT